MFWNGLNKTENFEKTQKAIHFDRFLIFSWNWSKTLRNHICFEMDWIKQKISKRHKKLYTVCVFSKPMDFWMGSLRKWSIFFKHPLWQILPKKSKKIRKKFTKNGDKISKSLVNVSTPQTPFSRIPQSSRISRADLFLCSNLPQASLIGSFDPHIGGSPRWAKPSR